jgi:CheY-like chemotaxis protein
MPDATVTYAIGRAGAPPTSPPLIGISGLVSAEDGHSGDGPSPMLSPSISRRPSSLRLDLPPSSVHPRLGEQVFLRFRVVDTGPGLDDAARDAVTRAAEMSPEAAQGSNLVDMSSGLRVSAALVRELGGRMSIKTGEVCACLSSPSVCSNSLCFFAYQRYGTRVTFVLPMRVDHNVIDNDPHVHSGLRSLRILVIQDVCEMLYVLKFYMDGTPHKADLASTGSQGLALYSQNEYDVVILDRYLSDMDGLELADRIRKVDAELHRPREADIVLTSAAVSPERELEARAVGIQFFEPKPLTRTRLLEVLWQIAVSRTPATSPRVGSPPPGDSSMVVDLVSMSRVNWVRVWQMSGLICQSHVRHRH